MKIVAAALDIFSGALGGRVGNGLVQWERREGLLLRLMDDEDEIGQGEASPLPGYSPETAPAAAAALRAFPWHLLPPLETDSSPDTASVFGPFWSTAMTLLDAHLPPAALPSARFAAESALLDLAGRALGEPAHRLLRRTEAGDIPLNAWIAESSRDDLDPGSVLDGIARACARGIAIVKLKVGHPGRFADELTLIRSVRDRFGDGIGIRLDANEGWTFDEARDRLHALASLAPEYVEQPVPAAELPRLTESSPVPLAADESLRNPAARTALFDAATRGSTACRVVMLKPAVLGGFEACRAIARQASAAGMSAVVSHLLDGPVALAAACELALSLEPAPIASGLDRHAGLDAWPGMTIPHLGPAVLHAHSAPGLGIALMPGAGVSDVETR